MFSCLISICFPISFFHVSQGATGLRNEKKRNTYLVEKSQPIVSAYRVPNVIILSKRSENPIIVKEGGNITLFCEATGHPKPEITWTVTSLSLRKKVNKKNPTLVLSQLTRFDQSRVTCHAKNGIGNPASATKKIRVLYLDKPKMAVQTSRGAVDPKSIWFQNSVYFRCEVISEAEVTYKWTFNGLSIPFESTTGITPSRFWLDSTAEVLLIVKVVSDRMFFETFGSKKAATRLRIKNSKPVDEGRYECIASLGNLGETYGIPDTRSSFNYKSDIASAQVRIAFKSSVVVNKNEKIKVECRAVKGVPRPTLTWVRRDGRVMSKKSFVRSFLIIENASYSDTGPYYCFGVNHVGVASKGRIDIYVRRLQSMSFWITPQKFIGLPEIPRWSLVEGSDVRLSCSAKADPSFELVYSWFKLVGQGQRKSIPFSPPETTRLKISLIRNELKRSFTIPAMSSRLEISNLTPDDYGVYVCSATLRGARNSSEEVNASIALGRESGPSQITAASPFPVQVVEGRNATLSCLASSTPKPLILFYRTDNGSMPNGRKMQVSKDGNLILPNVAREDEGSYLCKAARYNGFTRRAERQTEAYVDLVVLTPPSVYQNYFDIRKPLGSMVDMICAVTTANPRKTLKYQWFKDGVAQGKTSHNDQIQITSIGKNLYGVYTCNVTNGIGFTSCVFNVSNKPYAPEFYYLNPRPLVVENQDAYSYLLSWTQRQPSAVEPVIAYKVRWKLRDVESWMNGTVQLPDGAQYGQLISFKLTNLKTGMYEVVVTPMTRETTGDAASILIDVHLRSLRNVSPITSSYNIGRTFFCSFSYIKQCNFSQPPSDALRWILNSKQNQIKRTRNTGPDFDHSDALKEGAYYFIESSNKRKGDQARLISPRFFYNGESKGYCLKFYYHMKGQDIGKLRVLLLNSSANQTVLWSREREQGPAWLSGLKSFYTSSDYQIVFEATILEDGGYQGDIAIDDISLEALPCVLPSATVLPPKKYPRDGNGKSPTKAVFFQSVFHFAMTVYCQTLLLCLIFQHVIISEFVCKPT